MADASNCHASPQGAGEIGQPQLPGELLYIVVSYVVMEYLDDLIAGPLALPPPDFAFIQSEMARIHGATRAGLDVEVSEPFDFHSDKILERSNPAIALLQTGVQLRATTLDVLSELVCVKLSRSRIGRLEEKPWHTIQLLRYSWINPAYIPYFRLRYSFQIKGVMSPMIMAYTLSSSIRFELQDLREAMAVVRNEPPLVTYLRLKDYIGHVSTSWSLPMTLSNRIGNEAARAVVSKRLTMLAIEMIEFVMFEVYVTIWRHYFDLVCTAEELFQEVEDNKQTIESTTVLVGGIQLDGSDTVLSGTYDSLGDMLSLPYDIAIESGSLLSRNDLSIPEKMTLARETLQLIIQHQGREGFDYAQCQKAALKLHDWLDSMYGSESSSEDLSS